MERWGVCKACNGTGSLHSDGHGCLSCNDTGFDGNAEGWEGYLRGRTTSQAHPRIRLSKENAMESAIRALEKFQHNQKTANQENSYMFKKAQRTQTKLKIGFSGPSGSGKTYSALRLATGMGGRIAVIDTENNSASLYGNQFNFDVASISAPYTTAKYLAALKQAEDDGYDIIIIDSTSHQWAGDGGILWRKEQVDRRGGNSFTNWSKFTPEHEQFKSAVINCTKHLICTLRSKQDYVMGENSKGKQAPTKVGLAPVQREGFEFELSLMFDMAMDHSAAASKDRTSLFDGQIIKITEETGKTLMQWLSSAKAEELKPFKLTDDDKRKLVEDAEKLGHTRKEIADWLNGFPFLSLDQEKYDLLCARFTKPKENPEPGDFQSTQLGSVGNGGGL
jgi:hypothetical protein